MRKSNIIKLYIGLNLQSWKRLSNWCCFMGNFSVHFHCFCMYELLVCAKLLAEIRLKAPKRLNMVKQILRGASWLVSMTRYWYSSCYIKYANISLHEFAKNSSLVFINFRNSRCNTSRYMIHKNVFNCIYKICS